MKYSIENIGKRIKSEVKKNKEKLGFANLEEYSEHLHISRATLDNWTRGKGLSLDTLISLCEEFDCELGYLLCEDGYENKTRTATDICEATGLSEKAVSKLQSLRKENKEKEKAWAERHKVEIFPFSLVSTEASFTSCFLENGKELFTVVNDYIHHERKMQEIKNMPYYESLKRSFDDVQKLDRQIPLKYSDDSYEVLEGKDVFYEMLENMLRNYYGNPENRNGEIKAHIENGLVIFNSPEEKDRFLRFLDEQCTVDSLVDEAMCMLQYGYDVFELLHMEQNRKYFKYELSDIFMDIVKAYVKEGVENGGKD